MISTDAGIKVLKSLAKHAELIIQAYESGNNHIPDTQENSRAITELVKLNLAIRDTTQDGSIRLNSTLKNLLDQSLKTNRLKMVNANIGEAVEGIVLLTTEYNKAKLLGSHQDSTNYLNELEGNITELCDSLTEQAREIWRQIDSDFGTATLLSGKMALNKNALNKVQRILHSLELMDLETLRQLSSRDKDLRKLLHIRLPAAIDFCRQDLSDALHRLNKMMFKLNQLATQAKMVHQMVDHYTFNPSFEPEDYSERLDIPELFHRAHPLPCNGLADTTNSSLETTFTEIIEGLRNEPPPEERQESHRISATPEQQKIETIKWDEFKKAIRHTFFTCLDENRPLSGMESYIFAPEGTDMTLWLYALMAEYNAMNDKDRSLFKLEFPGKYDLIFTANYLAEDVVLCPA